MRRQIHPRIEHKLVNGCGSGGRSGYPLITALTIWSPFSQHLGMLWQSVLMLCYGLGTKTTWLELEKRSCFWLKYQHCLQKHGSICPNFLSKISGFCRHTSLDTSEKNSSSFLLKSSNTDMNCGHWLSSLPACNSTTIPIWQVSSYM